jgi:hydrogenase nickel incorporation protein HypA/HybF
MHELAVCQGLLKQVDRIAAEHKASAVEAIYIQVGPLSGVEPELLESAFPLARAGTIASNAQLVIHAMPVRIHCDKCNTESVAAPNRLLCSKCGGWQTRLVGGNELLLERIELQAEH